MGFGNVGRSLAKLLLEEKPIEDVEIAGVSNSKGSVIIEGPVDRAMLLKILNSNGRLEDHSGFRPGIGAVEASKISDSDVAFITIPPSYETGEPNRSIYYGLIDSDISIITADKTLLAIEYNKIMSKIAEKCLYLGYRATVAAGTPVLDVAKGLRGRAIRRVEAVLNASTNYILGLVERGYSFQEAIEEAIRVKLAEPDPRIDIEGFDPAGKLVILANTLGYEATINNVKRIPLTAFSEDRIREALREGRRVKYVASIDVESEVFKVEPRILSADSPLARAEGEDNVVVFDLENTSIVVRGPAGPAWRTARVMITDLMEYIEFLDRASRCGCR